MKNTSKRVRRCGVVMIEPREALELDLAGLFAGTRAVRASVKLVALAPHVGDEIELDAAEVAALGRVGDTDWVERTVLAEHIPEPVIDSLLAKGIFVGDGDTDAPMRERDETVRGVHWKPLSAVAHAFSRWHEAGVDEDVRITRHRTLTDLIREIRRDVAVLVDRELRGDEYHLTRSDHVGVGRTAAQRRGIHELASH